MGRHPDAKRLSQPICDWVREGGRFKQEGLQRYTQANMSQMQLKDLPIKLGCHYMYRHQGNCDHVIIFNQMRMFNNQDIQNVKAYPFAVFGRSRRERSAAFVTSTPPNT